MSIAALCASHTPLKDYLSPGADIEQEVSECFSGIRTWVEDFAPELIVVLGPDHFNGFFYRLMPSFCVGAAAQGVGDWKTSRDPFPIDVETAETCVKHLHQSGIDAALSYQMTTDHGCVQIMDQLFDWPKLPPILPIFINCAAPPLPPLHRTVAFGQALGRFLATLHRRVLVIGSGGLSHDPPIPQLADAPPEVRQRIIEGGELSIEARAARQKRVIRDAVDRRAGTSERTPLNLEWDRRFLDLLMAQDFDQLCTLNDLDITKDGGCGGHEIRTWMAASAVIQAVGNYTPTLHYYRAIEDWIAGYAVMSFDPSEA